MPLILCECALHRFCQRPKNWTLLIKVIFKFFLALKQWLVCTIFSATILLHLRTQSSKNHSLIFLHVFILIFSIISPTNTPRMMNQPIQSTLQFLHSILTIQLTFPKYFYIFLIFHATPKFLPRRRAHDNIKGSPAEIDRRPERGSGEPRAPRNRPRRRAPNNCSRLSWAVQAGNSRSHC